MPQKNQESTDTAFKNWINEALVKRMAKHIAHHDPEFDSKAFIKLSHKLPELELKPRMRLICDFLKNHIPEDYKKALAILLKATKEPAPGVSPLRGFDLWAFTEYVHRYGLKDFDSSMKALHTFTELFTAEFAIRPFLIHEESKTLKVLQKWSKDKNHHVRRLVSEGSRPRLPWGEQLKSFIKDPTPTIKLLDQLKYDEELYVRKSVANHLNDISKDHPDIAIRVAARWMKEAPKEHKEKIGWIIRHALRTLLKKGNKEALKLLGFENKGKVQVKNLLLVSDNVKIGSHLEFSFEVACSEAAQIMVDYLIHHKKANGKTSPKVFKLTTKTMKHKEVISIKKKHSFKPITTRVYYPGTHYLEIMVNGKLLEKVPFELKK
ncbi:MAG: DNA alkylation repair protein [Bdellovibrio sp. ArHS]|uniref:DNA alkylation repair protein n=1 Tax=Bdellovibrio sp. ArHS TaxID=1569284 RepID=UPI0005837242|nr:DNA alkylation repair protein [Bdellovibrio sp. ArHS]KHD87655.1 MAG: DNA alkylation repair protein [Bdellovibrio sp. ArHS]